jgi:hypothetical protein
LKYINPSGSDPGFITDEIVLEDARSESSPLHAAFDWDDAIATHADRLKQARELIEAVVWVDEQGNEHPAWIPVDTVLEFDQESIRDLENPAFLEYLRQQGIVGRINPDSEDFDWSAPAQTNKERAEQYRLAQARRLIRMYRDWKAKGN